MNFPFGELRSLKHNWDSYGGEPIDERAIQKAYALWIELGASYQVIPTSDGGVQLEEHRGGFDITVCVNASPTSAKPQTTKQSE